MNIKIKELQLTYSFHQSEIPWDSDEVCHCEDCEAYRKYVEETRKLISERQSLKGAY